MDRRINLERLSELWRYYQAGIVNIAFGFGLYALLVALGLNLYVAQIVSHVVGMAFNYFTYSRHAFKGSSPAKLRFMLSYIVNYFVSLGVLALITRVVASPYLAGLFTAILVSIANYVALKRWVFARRTAQ